VANKCKIIVTRRTWYGKTRRSLHLKSNVQNLILCPYICQILGRIPVAWYPLEVILIFSLFLLASTGPPQQSLTFLIMNRHHFIA